MPACFREIMILSFMITTSSPLLFLLPKCVHPQVISFYFSCLLKTALLRYKITYQNAHRLRCTIQWFVVWLKSYAVITTSNCGTFSSCQNKTPMSISSHSPFSAPCSPWSPLLLSISMIFVYSWQSIAMDFYIIVVVLCDWLISPHIKFSKLYHSRYQYFISFWQNNILFIWIYHSFWFINWWTSWLFLLFDYYE